VYRVIEKSLDQLISEAVEAVLETMFFSASLGPAEAVAGEAVLEARVSFRGIPSGTLSVRLSEASARTLAAGFLGEDEGMLTVSQSGQIVCELANMLCGMLVSKLEVNGTFDLTPPELIAIGDLNKVGPVTSPAAQQNFALDNGTLTVTLHLGMMYDPRK
jgi:CheY-specific phosphatase CheX